MASYRKGKVEKAEMWERGWTMHPHCAGHFGRVSHCRQETPLLQRWAITTGLLPDFCLRGWQLLNFKRDYPHDWRGVLNRTPCPIFAPLWRKACYIVHVHRRGITQILINSQVPIYKIVRIQSKDQVGFKTWRFHLYAWLHCPLCLTSGGRSRSYCKRVELRKQLARGVEIPRL